MVRKCSKAGLHTGNTIRLSGGHPFLNRFQKYSYFVADADALHYNQRKALKEVMDILPFPDGHLEYSMNKKKRWQLPKVIHSTLRVESDNPNLNMAIMEHTRNVGEACDEHQRSCSSLYSNYGDVLEKQSHREMNMKSAMQGNYTSDHLSKKERRELKRAQREQAEHKVQEPCEPDEDAVPTYHCHIVRGAPSDGRLYKDLMTKGVLVTRSSRSRGTYSSCKLNKFDFRDELSSPDLYIEDDDDATQDDESTQRQLSKSVPIADLIVPSSSKMGKGRFRRRSGEILDKETGFVLL